MRNAGRRSLVAALAGLALARASATWAAGTPDPDALLAELGVSASDVASVHAGNIVTVSPKPSTPREIAAGFAFLVPTAPGELQKEIKSGLLASIDPNTISRGEIDGGPDDLSGLKLQPERESRAKAYAGAEAGDALNLSTAEISALRGLEGPDAVEKALRGALFARYQAYRSKGLAGIAPYDRGDGETRSPAEDLRAATNAARGLQKHAPAFYAFLEDYPSGPPAGLEEMYLWSQFQAHDVPTIALVHAMFVPEGEGWVVSQRQFYVSSGFNCEEAFAAFLPSGNGTMVLYVNRTSTDQVTGFGGSAKRSIGSKLLASQLEGLFRKLQKENP